MQAGVSAPKHVKPLMEKSKTCAERKEGLSGNRRPGLSLLMLPLPARTPGVCDF